MGSLDGRVALITWRRRVRAVRMHWRWRAKAPISVCDIAMNQYCALSPRTKSDLEETVERSGRWVVGLISFVADMRDTARRFHGGWGRREYGRIDILAANHGTSVTSGSTRPPTRSGQHARTPT